MTFTLLKLLLPQAPVMANDKNILSSRGTNFAGYVRFISFLMRRFGALSVCSPEASISFASPLAGPVFNYMLNFKLMKPWSRGIKEHIYELITVWYDEVQVWKI